MRGAFGRRWVVGCRLSWWSRVLISRVEDCRKELKLKNMPAPVLEFV